MTPADRSSFVANAARARGAAWTAAAPAPREPGLGWARYLPAAVFLAFFLPNTRFAPVNNLFLAGRWAVLVLACGLAILFVHAARAPLQRFSGLTVGLFAALFCLTVTLPYSNNFMISAAKWAVLTAFIAFCVLLFGTVRSREAAVQALRPLIYIFTVFIWTMPLGILYYPQALSYLGYVNGYLRFPNAVGQFLALFGVPAILFHLQTVRGRYARLFHLATLALGLYLAFACGSRTSAFIVTFLLGVAFLRWRGLPSRGALPLKVAVVGLVLLLSLGEAESLESFIYKYPGVKSLLQSRSSYWDATSESFLAQRWFGTGFGVQESQIGVELSYQTRGAFREQGSTYLGILEEIGALGAVPFFLLFIALAVRHGWVLMRSHDPLALLLSRSVVAALLWGVSENFLLYLGNAASILFFYSFFLSERLARIKAGELAAWQRYYALLAQWRAASRAPGRSAPELGAGSR